MKHYELANISKNEAGETSVVAKGEITAEQYLEIRSWFKFTYFYHVCQSIEHMTLESGEDLANYFAELENYTGPFTKDYNKFLTTANKLLISYLSFLRIYVDVVSHAISRKSKEKFEEFNNATHIVYDTLLGYRFFSRMRNYVVHYDVPLTSITCSVSNGIQVTCKRKSLLEYNGWGSVKKEIEQLPEEIDIFPFIGECQAAVKRLYCNGVQREHNKKLNNGLPILHKVPPKRDYGRYFCIMAEKGGTSHGGLTEKLSLFFHAKKQEVNAYGR